MSKETKNNKENEERDIRMPENEESQEEQREKSIHNTEKEYEAESPADPYADPDDGITDRAQDNIDPAENDTSESDTIEDDATEETD